MFEKRNPCRLVDGYHSSRALVTFTSIFDSEVEGIRSFRNVGNYLEDCRVTGRTLQPKLRGCYLSN
jgi:hypothetical protein